MMMELIVRISSDGTEHADTASKTVLSERRKAPRETRRRRLLGVGTLQRQRRGEGARGVTPAPNPQRTAPPYVRPVVSRAA